MTDTNTYHHGNLRDALIDAGIALLEAKGLSGLTLRACAAHAGVSHTAPQNHFKNLAGLQTAIAARGYETLHTTLIQGVSETAPPDQRRRAAFSGYVAFATDHPGLFELMFSRDRTTSDDPELLKHAEKCFAVLAAGADNFNWGTASPTTPELSAQVLHWSLVHGFAQLKISGKLDKGPMQALTIFDVLPEFDYDPEREDAPLAPP